MKRNQKTTEELVSRAIIKIKKRQLIENIKEKALEDELTDQEKTLLIESIYNHYNELREHLFTLRLFNIKQQTEISDVSLFVLDAVYNALDKNDNESIRNLVKQYNRYVEYYKLIINKDNKENIEDKRAEIILNKSLKK